MSLGEGIRPAGITLRSSRTPIPPRRNRVWMRHVAEERRRGMPYEQITQLPDGVKNNLPEHAQGQYGEESHTRRVA